jgi:hypothetical protein
MTITQLAPGHTVHVQRVADDGLRVPPTLPVALADLEDFHFVAPAEPGAPQRLAAWIKAGAREWSTVREEVLIVAGDQVTLAALGHRVDGHTCADCAPTPPPKARDRA